MPGAEETMVPKASPSSYYGRPILKEPVWKWQIPAYLFAGGVSAGSSVLAFGATLAGNRRLRRAGRLSALASIAASAVFLVWDLGRPSRFHHMLRVAKPTSPMSMGSWLLSVFGPATGLAAGADVLGVLDGLGTAANAVSAATAPLVATYTAVLVADTAIPAWHEARHHLPFVFAGSAAAAAGGLLAALVPGADGDPAARLAVLGAGLGFGALQKMEQAMGDLIAEPYHQGTAGRLAQLAKAATATGTAALVVGRRRRTARVAGGALLVAGSALERFAVFEAGRQSARDPKYVVTPQTAELGEKRGARAPVS